MATWGAGAAGVTVGGWGKCNPNKRPTGSASNASQTAAVADQYRLISGRAPVWVGSAEVPTHVPDLLSYSKATVKYLEPKLFQGIKIELPPSYTRLQLATEDKIRDIVRGRGPLSDLDQIVEHWRRSGGDDGRAFLEKVLADNGR